MGTLVRRHASLNFRKERWMQQAIGLVALVVHEYDEALHLYVARSASR